MAAGCGISREEIAAALKTFKSVKRRLEVRAKVNGITIIDDFAHHPTAIAGTLTALRSNYPGARLWAILEPRSNTLRRNVLQNELAKSLALADEVVVANVFKSEAIPEAERLDLAHGRGADPEAWPAGADCPDRRGNCATGRARDAFGRCGRHSLQRRLWRHLREASGAFEITRCDAKLGHREQVDFELSHVDRHRATEMIRTLVMLGFWAALLPFAALIGFPWTLITGDVSMLYRMTMWGAWNGVRLAGIHVKTVGLDKLDPARTYIFMSNHVSNVDPPILMPLIPRRMSVMVKKELFRVPVLARLMRFGSLVPVDRGNRESGIAAVRGRRGCDSSRHQHDHLRRRASLLRWQASALQEGTVLLGGGVRRSGGSGDYRRLARRHAQERFAIKPGTVTVIFHAPDRAQRFRQPRLPDGESSSSHRQRFAG